MIRDPFRFYRVAPPAPTYGPVELPMVEVQSSLPGDFVANRVRQGGAAFMRPVVGLMGQPQLDMVEMFTGVEQTPSEAMGISNPVAEFLINSALDPLNAVGVTSIGGLVMRNSMRNPFKAFDLKNAYKYNPWAFKPNPEAYYRGVGKEGVEDALKTGLIRSKNTDMFRQPYFARPGEFETALYYNPEALIEAKGFDVLNLKGKGPDIDLPKLNFAKRDAGALPVTPKYAEGILGKPETKDWYFDWDVESIPVNHPDIKLLQKDWLRGYKEVSKPASGSK